MPFRLRRRYGPTPPEAPVIPAAAVTLLVAIVGLLATPDHGTAQDEGIALGATPDAITLETLDGQPVELKGLFADKPVLLEFWATWCTVCRALEPAMKAADETYGDRIGIVVVAAAVAQTRERVEQHLARHPMPGRLVWDTRGRFTRAFDAPGTGYVVILDADGRVAYTGTGADQDLVRALAEVLKGTER